MSRNQLIGAAAAAVFLVTTFSTDLSAALSDGYILVGAYGGKVTVLIDTAGKTVKTWTHGNMNGYSCYVLPNGNLLRSAQVGSGVRIPPSAAPQQGMIEEVDSAGKVVWTYTLSNDTFHLHHDMKPLSNGHIIASCFHFYSKAQVKSAGIDTNLLKGGMGTSAGLLGDRIVEIDPKAEKGKEIVWEWRILDHVVPKEQAASHPEKISGSIVSSLWQNQWVHLNGLDYNPKTDLIVWSSRIFSECFVIDHSTTKEQAKGSSGGNYGKGGDILYRWGKPGNYGASGATTIECLHSTTWIPEGYPGAGNIMFFHNNIMAVKSQVVEIKPPLDAEGKFVLESGKPFGPVEPTWKYAPESDFYSRFMSSAMRMPSGHTVAHETFPTKSLPAEGTIPSEDSRIREVDPEGKTLWTYTLKLEGQNGFNAAKIMYYPGNYVGVRKLLNLATPAHGDSRLANSLVSGPNVRRIAGLIDFSNVKGCDIELFDIRGKKALSVAPKGASFLLKAGLVPKGVYCAKITSSDHVVSLRMVEVLR